MRPVAGVPSGTTDDAPTRGCGRRKPRDGGTSAGHTNTARFLPSEEEHRHALRSATHSAIDGSTEISRAPRRRKAGGSVGRILRGTLATLFGPLLAPVHFLPLVDVAIVLAQRLGEDMRAVVSADEIEIRHVFGAGRGHEAGETGRSDRSGRQPRIDIGVVGRIVLQVVPAQMTVGSACSGMPIRKRLA
jgi:hypothetical protein